MVVVGGRKDRPQVIFAGRVNGYE